MKQYFIKSTNLFLYPSFLKGVARFFDLFGGLDKYNYSKSELEADTNALKRDWKIVGLDILNSIKKYESINFRQ